MILGFPFICYEVKYNSNVFSGDPDFAPLQQQFDVINTSRKNNFQYITDNFEASINIFCCYGDMCVLTVN